ncbi:MAG TPA: DNA-3-methyladenine glycosylase [Polyangiaceae bacterium]|nr:DNA-3-methyladenine glycosylase [Polyangiaceae bacterium]
MARLPRSFYARDTLLVARELLGMHLVHETPRGRQIGRIVETEAYQGPRDLAAHSARKKSERTAPMFGPAGHAYVYLIYGMWNCLNVVTREPDVPHAVLLRAVEPVSGIELPTHGPGLLCKALGLDRSYSGLDLTRGALWIERPRNHTSPRIQRAPRIGVDYAGAWAQKPWRFFDADSAWVSTVSPAARRRATAARLLQPVSLASRP